MDNRRLFPLLIFIFSLIMLFDAWHKYKNPKPPAVAVTQEAATPQPSASLRADDGKVPGTNGENTVSPAASLSQQNQSGEANATPVAADKAEILTIKTDLYSADISTLGGDIVRLELNRYKANEDKEKKFLLIDPGHQYVVQTGLIGPQGTTLPYHKTLFTAAPGPHELGDRDELQVFLAAEVAAGIKVNKVLTFKRNSYEIGVTYAIENGSPQPLAAHAYFQLQRDDAPPTGESRMISTYTGPALYDSEKKYQKVSFSDIEKGKTADVLPRKTNNGWLAMVQHYFVTAWLPQGHSEREFYVRKIGTSASGKPVVAAGVILSVPEIAPGGKAALTVPFYAGPQEQARLKKLAEGFNLVVDYGWLTVIAAPIFQVLEWIHGLVGNWGWAIVVLTIIIKLIFYPLSAASYKSMAKMRTVTPRLMALKERYGNDRQRLNQEMMKLYQTEKINPLGGCLPILVQIPVFIALYWALLGAVEMRDAPWILWIHDLSSADPYYILPVVMMLTMILQTRLNPTPPDPIQAKVMMMMPFIFGVMFFFFPAGLVLYWVVNNVLSIAQQWQITRMIEKGKDGGKAGAEKVKTDDKKAGGEAANDGKLDKKLDGKNGKKDDEGRRNDGKPEGEDVS